MPKKGAGSADTGVINPYAMIASKKGSKFDWNTLAPGEMKKLLETEFRLPYHRLFDPAHGSPLFSHGKKIIENTLSPSVETGELAPRMTVPVENWMPYPGGTFSSPQPSPDISDVNQGCSLNCWFAASLASVAWTWPDKITKIGACSIKYYKGITSNVPPYMPADGVDYTPVLALQSTNLNLPFGKGGAGNWVYCRPNAHPNALWAALFEKDYARFYQLPDITTDKPDPAGFETGNPLNALVHLTGKKYYSKMLVDNLVKNGQIPSEQASNARSTYDMVNFVSPDDVFNKIYDQCFHPPVSGGILPPAEPRMTIYPMVAWTYSSETVANGANAVDPAQNPEKCVKYSSDSIVARHSYSVLGVHYLNGKKYIVLRNPWGMSIPGGFGGDPKFIDPNSDPSDDIYYTEMAKAVATGTWTVTPMPRNANSCLGDPPNPVSLDLGKNDGIFALAVDKFRSHFAGFGWVR